MGKNAQTHPLPSSIKNVHFLCFLWHSSPAFQMHSEMTSNDLFQFLCQQQHSMRGRRWTDSLLGWPDVAPLAKMPPFSRKPVYFTSACPKQALYYCLGGKHHRGISAMLLEEISQDDQVQARELVASHDQEICLFSSRQKEKGGKKKKELSVDGFSFYQ